MSTSSWFKGDLTIRTFESIPRLGETKSWKNSHTVEKFSQWSTLYLEEKLSPAIMIKVIVAHCECHAQKSE